MVDKTVIIVTHNSSEIEDNSNIIYIEQENGSDGSNNPLIPDTPEILP